MRIEITERDASMLASRRPALVIRARSGSFPADNYIEVVVVLGQPDDARRTNLGRQLAQAKLINRLNSGGPS